MINQGLVTSVSSHRTSLICNYLFSLKAVIRYAGRLEWSVNLTGSDDKPRVHLYCHGRHHVHLQLAADDLCFVVDIA